MSRDSMTSTRPRTRRETVIRPAGQRAIGTPAAAICFMLPLRLGRPYLVCPAAAVMRRREGPAGPPALRTGLPSFLTFIAPSVAPARRARRAAPAAHSRASPQTSRSPGRRRSDPLERGWAWPIPIITLRSGRCPQRAPPCPAPAGASPCPLPCPARREGSLGPGSSRRARAGAKGDPAETGGGPGVHRSRRTLTLLRARPLMCDDTWIGCSPGSGARCRE